MHDTSRWTEETGIPDLDDEDVVDAMRHIPGYLDITTDDFRQIYHLAFTHALERLAGRHRAGEIMRAPPLAVGPQLPLAVLVERLAAAGEPLAVVTEDGGPLLGVVTAKDVVRRLGHAGLPAFLAAALDGLAPLAPRLAAMTCGQVMSQPAAAVPAAARVPAVLAVMRRHPHSRYPVVDEAGRPVGILSRRRFMQACRLEGG